MQEKSFIIDVVKKTGPAVVSIIVSKYLSWLEEEYPHPFFGFPFLGEGYRVRKKKVKVGGGSGFIVSEDGLILTNRHVVADPNAEYKVITSKNEKLDVKILARDNIFDIAILKAGKKNLPTIPLGDSSKLELGQTAIAIGNALGEFQNTVSTGVISGLSRFITAHEPSLQEAHRLRGVIQTDAAINPGNSGGPLLDFEGRAIGINAASVLGAENIGFAIPINHAKKDLEQIKKHGKITHPSLGIRHIILTPELKERFNLPIDYGALIIGEPHLNGHAVAPGSPAEKAGLKERDIILECNGEKVTADNPLEIMVGEHETGDVIVLTVLKSEGKITKTKLPLTSRA